MTPLIPALLFALVGGIGLLLFRLGSETKVERAANIQWLRYLYQEHSEIELCEWASRLEMFRYCRAHGGHANDGDSLELTLRYKDTDNLIALMTKLGLSTTIFDNMPDQAVKGKSYNFDEFKAFPSLIPETQWIKQPGHCDLFGVRVCISCRGGLLNIAIGPPSYVVTNENVRAAELIETNLAHVKELVVDPPEDNKHCICPKYYPTFFK